MDIVSDQFVKFVILIVEINHCKIHRIDIKNRIFDIGSGSCGNMIDCAQMIEDFQQAFFVNKIVPQKILPTPN